MSVQNRIDAHVGSRIRLRRQLINMSQEKLGDAIGVTFQQVQKYERGANRVGASRLYLIAGVLQVPVSFFFDGLEPADAKGGRQDSVVAFINSSEGVELASAWSNLAVPAVRRQLLALVRTLAEEP